MIPGDRESIGDDLGVYSVDPEDQLSSADTLDGDGDPLDRGYVAADRLHGSLAHGVTAREQADGETLDQRIRQELPDPYATYDQSPDDVPLRVGRIVAPDQGLREDTDAELVADEGSPTSWDAPEESAMHYVDGDDTDELDEVEWTPSDEVVQDEDE